MKILVAVFFSFLLLFSVVPLSDANAIKAKGTSVQKYGSKTSNVVCGDKLCSDIIREGDANQQSRFAMGGVSQQAVPQLTQNLDSPQTPSTPSTMPNNPIISSSDLDEDYYNMIHQPLIQYIESKNKAFTSDEYYVDESTILSSLIEQRMLQLKFDARNSGGECAAAFATNDELQISQKCNLPLVEIRELTGADCPDCGDITKNGKKVGFKIKTLTRITYANAEQASKMTGVPVSQINWKEFKLTKDPNQDDSSFLQECQILGGTVQGNTCDATSSVIKRINDHSMSTENRKLIKADENGNPDPSDTEGLANYEEHSVRVSILETVEAKVPDEDVVANKIDPLIPANADIPQIIPKKTKPESKSLPDITSKSETIKKSSLDDFQDSIGRVFPVNGIPDADADVGTSKTKHFMTGFTIAPPNFNWSVGILVEGPCLFDWCFTWVDFGTGFGNYAGVGLRLPVEVTVSNIPTSLNAGQSFQIATGLTPLNFNAQQYRDFCQQENIANDSPYVYDCNAFAFARLNNPSIGDELAARAGVYFSTHLTLLEMQLWNLYKDFGIDLIEKCTTDVGVDCGDFKTPFGFTGRPISQTQNLRSFPFAAGAFMIPAMCGPGESICTGLGIGGSVASIGLGVGIHSGLGSDRINAHLYSSGDVAPTSSDVIVDYDAVRSANEPNAPLDPVKGYMRQSITVDNYDDSTNNITMTLDDMTYYLNRAEVEGRAMLDFGGAIGNYIPDIDLFRIFKINFAQSIGSISIPQHLGTDGMLIDPIPVNDYGFDISIRNSDGVLLDDFEVDKLTTTTLALYATNRGTQTDSFDNISISMKNPHTGESIPANIILTQNTINNVASGSAGTLLFDIDASNVPIGRYKLVAKGDSVGAKANNLQPTDPLGNKRINTVTNVPVDVTSKVFEGNAVDRRAMRAQSDGTLNSITLNSIKDSFVNSVSPTKNNGGNHIMKVDSKDRALVAFDRQAIINKLQGKEFSGASIQLRVEKIHNQWASYGGYVSVHKLTKDWDEGNGFNIPQQGVTLGPDIVTDGTGSGVTWNCVSDRNIASASDNYCITHGEWYGGSFSQNPASTILIGSNYQGQQVSFDVTEDVRRILNGEAGSSWLIKLSDEAVNGGVDFATKELAPYFTGYDANNNPYYPKLKLSYYDDSQDQNSDQNTKVFQKSSQETKSLKSKMVKKSNP